MKKKIFIAIGTIAAMAMGVVGMSAFEAHVINVTAHIENAMDVPVQDISFNTVFPQEQLNQNITFGLSESFENQQNCDASNLVSNGSFELPAVTDPNNWQLFPDGASGLAWHVNWDPVVPATFNGNNRPDPALIEYQKFVVAGWNPQDGNQYAELHSDWTGPPNNLQAPAATDIYQDLSTTIGKQYTITFYYSPRPGVNAVENGLEPFWDGGTLGLIQTDGTSNPGTVWTKYTFTVTATKSTTRLEFDARGNPDSSTGTFLDNVSVNQVCNETNRVNDVTYVIKQKPKCGLPDPEHSGQYTKFEPAVEDANGNFTCATVVGQGVGEGSYQLVPLLCPYLSKHIVDQDGNDGTGISSFHGLPGVWNSATADASAIHTVGELSTASNDLTDTWNIDLAVPCFNGSCGQDWASFVQGQNPNADPLAYEADPANEGTTFGCDLWVEVTGIGNKLPNPNFFVGNDAEKRTIVDTYQNFTIIDTNHPATGTGNLTHFFYWAANTNPLRFVVVDGAGMVKWVSDPITPSIVGVNEFVPVSPAPVQAGWNVGIYSASTGVIPFEYVGSPANYTANNAGLPVVGATLNYEGSSGRTYSFVAN